MARLQQQNLEQLTTAIEDLLASIKSAIQRYTPGSVGGAQNAQDWNSPHPWQTVALPNLEAYQQAWLAAVGEFKKSGNEEALKKAALNFSGLGKKIDFSTQWMSTLDHQLVEQAIDRTGESAYRIYM